MMTTVTDPQVIAQVAQEVAVMLQKWAICIVDPLNKNDPQVIAQVAQEVAVMLQKRAICIVDPLNKNAFVKNVF
ncbi:UNVERIFIED_CONTAM: hypothetical protein FKN15_030983 [Acipenser sinensis]